MTTRTLIIDDESLARQRIKKLLSTRPDIEIVGECRNGREAISAIREQKPELIFLDIQMKDMTGFEVLEELNESEIPLTIFVTAFDQYAVKAFDVFAFDYLLKPFKEDRFYLSLDKALVTLQQREQEGHIDQLRQLVGYLKQKTGEAREPLALKQGSKISLVNIDDIRYIEASGYYIEVYTDASKRHLLRESMTNMLEQLAEPQFMRIHRSTIINTRYLAEIQHTGAGEVVAKMQDGKTFRVSKSYKDELFRRLKL
ncbi:MAG: response regulator transcription factor [Lewinella sp.]|nr:response regulator transcription factor [Lewinella sp.]